MQASQRRTAPGGLSAAQAEQARREYGSNEFEAQKQTGFWGKFIANFADPVIKILLIALAVNLIFLFRNQNWFETMGIALAIALATLVSTISEYGSESAFRKMQEDAGRIQARVMRDGQLLSLPLAEIVVGDVVYLQAGERVPADGVVVSGGLSVDQSALNGESKEMQKRPQPASFARWDLSSPSQLFRGSIVTAGEAAMEVGRVGSQTFYGDMARQMQEETRESPLRVRLNGLTRVISRLGYLAAVLVFSADFGYSLWVESGRQLSSLWPVLCNFPVLLGHFMHALTLAISIVVVAVPEGLPMMITVVLSSNMLRMTRDHVLVRKLVGIETSGSLNLLFTDKTGTLTRGRLQVSSFIAGSGQEFPTIGKLKKHPALYRLTALSGLYNTGSTVSQGRPLGGNATDRALMEYVLPYRGAQAHVLSTVPFDSAVKFSAASIQQNGTLHFIKGAPEKLLPLCSHCYDDTGKPVPFTARPVLQARLEQLTKNGERVLVLATSPRPVRRRGSVPESLVLIGLVSIHDQIRPEARKAVQQVQNAGIQVVMITGDNAQTAQTIARQCGILPQGSPSYAVMTSDEMAQLTDAELSRRLRSLRVVARALPSDKSRLVRLSQQQGLVVGMTGDGINDAPALKKADVGFAMGSGTEVAKEAGDIVILDDNFSSIAKAILYGRTIFKSIRKFIVFQLTMNLCAVGVSVFGPMLGVDTPVTVVQMLWVNMIMDTLGGLAFAGEAPLKEYMKEPPKRRDEPILNRYMVNQILITGLSTMGLCLFFLKSDKIRSLFCYQSDPLYFLTAFFSLFIFCGVLNSFNARTHRINLFSHLWKNPTFVLIMAAVTGLQLVFIYYGGTLFRTTPLPVSELGFTFLLACLVLPLDLLRKIALRFLRRPRDF